jgi:predicted TIM-barrel fold metal-dependent hydrolase
LDIEHRQPKIVIIDTLGQPLWEPRDYWLIAKQFPNIGFILAHSGGWDIAQFLRISILEKNVWLDFSWTQEYFGWCGLNPKYRPVIETIDYGMKYKRLEEKVLFGSDNPFYSQSIAIQKYISLPNSENMLINNFLNLLDRSNIS